MAEITVEVRCGTCGASRSYSGYDFTVKRLTDEWEESHRERHDPEYARVQGERRRASFEAHAKMRLQDREAAESSFAEARERARAKFEPKQGLLGRVFRRAS